ncbi:hypothetical protein LX32DRAFT_253203 [Colletotrichum zoysiae]|uniref:Uncharacterized protein n=1 Tax=Colletotrichum zoysiae TaxID=1216348 RepID=A0AAD9M596_9PEZI|nr:hypothetical protein LX32DRAFT_253203 [Colletotrichum zoysiae]
MGSSLSALECILCSVMAREGVAWPTSWSGPSPRSHARPRCIQLSRTLPFSLQPSGAIKADFVSPRTVPCSRKKKGLAKLARSVYKVLSTTKHMKLDRSRPIPCLSRTRLCCCMFFVAAHIQTKVQRYEASPLTRWLRYTTQYVQPRTVVKSHGKSIMLGGYSTMGSLAGGGRERKRSCLKS